MSDSPRGTARSSRKPQPSPEAARSFRRLPKSVPPSAQQVCVDKKSLNRVALRTPRVRVVVKVSSGHAESKTKRKAPAPEPATSRPPKSQKQRSNQSAVDLLPAATPTPATSGPSKSQKRKQRRIALASHRAREALLKETQHQRVSASGNRVPPS